jgi:hypothetical protein
MRFDAEKVAEILALSESDRALLAHQVSDSLEPQIDHNATEERHTTVRDRRSQEIEFGKVDRRPVHQALLDIRTKLNAGHQPT